MATLEFEETVAGIHVQEADSAVCVLPQLDKLLRTHFWLRPLPLAVTTGEVLVACLFAPQARPARALIVDDSPLSVPPF